MMKLLLLAICPALLVHSAKAPTSKGYADDANEHADAADGAGGAAAVVLLLMMMVVLLFTKMLMPIVVMKAS